MQYVIGIIMILVGVLVIWKTNALVRAFGRIAWAEEKIGSAGTWTFYKIFGVVLIFLSFLIMSGDIVKVLDFILPF